MLDGDLEADRVLHNLTGADLPSSALGSVPPPSEIGWSSPVQTGVEMLNRGGFPQIQGPECDPGVVQSWSPAILAAEPPQPIPSHLVCILVRDETFPHLACGWQELGNEQSMLRTRADPQFARSGHRGTGGLLCACCVVACCVLGYCAVALSGERCSSIASRPPRPRTSPDGPESAGTPAYSLLQPISSPVGRGGQEKKNEGIKKKPTTHVQLYRQR